MKLFIFLLFLFFVPSNAWGWVPHEYPALYTHQLGRVFFLIAFICVLWAFVHNRLHKQRGWGYLFVSVIFFIIWDIDVFIGRIAESLIPSQIIGGIEGWQYFKRNIEIEGKEYLFYIAKFDYLLLNLAMLFFYMGLKEHLRKEEKALVSVAALPLLPVLISDIAGATAFMILSTLSLFTSIKLYRKDRENVLWNYMVWLSSSLVIFSISRSFGHILRHILIATGNQLTWKYLDGTAGSFNTFTLFLVGSVSLFFIRIYSLYMKISKDKKRLEKLVVERTRLIEQLERDKMELKELDKLKSAFLANISHELRTPMNTIIGYTDLLLDKVDGPVSEEQEKSLRKVAANARHLLRLINDVLDVSKIESGKIEIQPKELDLKRLIESLIPSFEPLIKQKGLILTVDFDENLPLIYGDDDRVKQVLINLLSNAVKFTHRGEITIRVKPSERGIKPGESPLFAEVCVEDTGIGIKEEDLGKIFDKFVQVDFTSTRQYEGTGLGLSITRALVALHKGVIWAMSKYGEGSKFCFTLPLKKEILEKHAETAIELSV